MLPLFHALAQMANLLLPLSVGARVVFLETVSSTALVAALGTRGITIFACVPQFFYLIHQRVMSEVGAQAARSRARILRGVIGAERLAARSRGPESRPPRSSRACIARSDRRMRLLVTGGSRFDPAIGRDLYGLGFTHPQRATA